MPDVLEVIATQGFRAPGRLAPGHAGLLRSDTDLVRRLMVVQAVASWVAAPEERVPSDLITRTVAASGGDVLGIRERTMLDTPREAARSVFLGQVGWAFEGAWALAWTLGYEPMPDPYGAMMDDERVVDVLYRFLPPLGTDPETWLARRDPDRFSDDAVAVLEGALERVEAASHLGRDAVPGWFHPFHHGRVVAERRRALTWALSPGRDWEDVYSGGPKDA